MGFLLILIDLMDMIMHYVPFFFFFLLLYELVWCHDIHRILMLYKLG